MIYYTYKITKNMFLTFFKLSHQPKKNSHNAFYFIFHIKTMFLEMLKPNTQ